MAKCTCPLDSPSPSTEWCVGCRGELLNCFAQARFGLESSEPEESDDPDDEGAVSAESLIEVLRDEVDVIHDATKSVLDRHEQQIAELQETMGLLAETCERLAKARGAVP